MLECVCVCGGGGGMIEFDTVDNPIPLVHRGLIHTG